MTFQPPGAQPQPDLTTWAPVAPPGAPGAVPPGMAPPPGVPPMGYPQPGPAPKSNATKWIIGSVIGVVLLALVATLAIVVVVSRAGGSSAGDTVKSYLEALARGDAKKALSYGAGLPGSTEFLTDEILKKQIEKAPVTNIQILSDSSDGSSSRLSTGRVHVSVKFGEKVSDSTLFMKRSGNEWKLETAAAKLDFRTGMDKIKTIKIFGKPIGDDESVYIFPGWMGIEPINSNISVDTGQVATLKDLNTYGSYQSTSSLDIKVSEAGYAAADKAIRDAIAKCVASKDGEPAGCPNRIYGDRALPGSVTWQMPVLPAWGDPSFSEYRLQLRYYPGRTEFPYRAMTASGPIDGTASSYMALTVDLSQSPPAVNFR